MDWRKNTILLFLLLAAAVLLLAGEDATTPAETPAAGPKCPGCNVVLISLDTLRADHLGLYGYYRNTSPNIDYLANNALVYTDCVSQAPWTLPAHMSMLTALYSSNHGVIDKEKNTKLSNSTLTLADVLYKADYATAAFTGGNLLSMAYNYHTFDIFDDSGGWNGKNFKKVLDWVGNGTGRRFFLFWHDYQPHCPYNPSTEFDNFTDRSYSGMLDVRPRKNTRICMENFSISCVEKCGDYFERMLGNMSEADLEYVKAKYDGDILEADDRIGRLMRLLEERGLLNNTVVVFTSDHGESFAERETRKRIEHHLMYEEVLHVPLIIKIPGINGGVHVNRTVELVDVMPTILDILNMSVPGGLDGESLLAESSGPEKESGYSEHFYDNPEYSLKQDSAKIIYYKKDDYFELYDLESDPHERNNIFKNNTRLGETMKALLKTKIPETIKKAETAELDEETIKQLRAAGYLD